MAWTTNHLGPDGLPPVGYWGPITSTLMWCEDKYRWSKYIAEPMNSFTNVGFVSLALYGAYCCHVDSLPRRFFFTQMGLAYVGLASFGFHATLLHEFQLQDELSMIYTSLFLSYCILETNEMGKRPTGGVLLPVALAAIGVLVTVGYLAMPNPVLHQLAYAAIQLATTYRVVRLLYGGGGGGGGGGKGGDDSGAASASPSSSSSSTPRNLQSPLSVTAAGREKRRMIRANYQFGAAVFLIGFAIWNCDNILCDPLRLLRARVGYPVAALLEGHAWWHVLTGWGAYHLIVSAELLNLCLKESPECWTFAGHGTWLAFLLPRVQRIKPYTPGGGGASGGSASRSKAKAM